MEEQGLQPRLSKALGVWAKRNNVTPARFRDEMGWSYNYAWRVLRGRDRFSEAAWGKFILVYGLNSLAELFRIAGVDPNKVLG